MSSTSVFGTCPSSSFPKLCQTQAWGNNLSLSSPVILLQFETHIFLEFRESLREDFSPTYGASSLQFIIIKALWVQWEVLCQHPLILDVLHARSYSRELPGGSQKRVGPWSRVWAGEKWTLSPSLQFFSLSMISLLPQPQFIYEWPLLSCRAPMKMVCILGVWC